MSKNLEKEVKELNNRISELEKMLSKLVEPMQKVSSTTQKYLKITNLILEHGGLTPDLILPEIKDPIAREIVRALLDRTNQNISQITELVRSRRGTSSRRIIRERLQELEEKNIVHKKHKGSRKVYSLTPNVIKKWSQILGFNI